MSLAPEPPAWGDMRDVAQKVLEFSGCEVAGTGAGAAAGGGDGLGSGVGVGVAVGVVDEGVGEGGSTTSKPGGGA